MPNFLFGPDDVVVAVGPDGLVANTLKYLDGQPLIAVNPDPALIDGSVIAGAWGIAGFLEGHEIAGDLPAPGWASDHLYYSVREPFPSNTTGTTLSFGRIYGRAGSAGGDESKGRKT